MVNWAPDQPWLYLLVFGSFMVFILTFGLILGITQQMKKRKQKEAEEEETTA